MNLVNTLPHMRGKSIMVNGTTYVLDAHGVAHDVAAEDADKLLRRTTGAWRVYAERHPVQGQASGDAPPAEDATVPNLDTSAVLAAQDQFEARKRGEANPAPSEQPEGDEVTPAAGAAEEAQDDAPPAEDADAAEAPGPQLDASMAIDDLRQMADAYEVTYNARTSKETLIKRVAEAMKE